MDESQTPKRLLRSRDDRYIGGVAAGVANYFSIDPTLVRVIFLVSLAFGGIGVLAYFALLFMMPIEGPADEELPPIGKQRRNLMIGAAIVLGAAVVLTVSTGGFAEWIFGFGPGTFFGVLLWTAALVAVIWLVAKYIVPGSGGGAGPGESGSQTASRATMATSPSQNAPTDVMPAHDDRTDVMPASTPTEPRSGSSSAGKVAGQVMTGIAVGITALIGLSVLAIVATWTTAQFGGIPMSLTVIVLGTGMIVAGIQGRRRLSVWLLAAALTVAIPMSIVALADLRIDGSYGSPTETPTLFSDIPADGYSLAAGRMVVDLRELPFRRNQTVDVKVNSGLGMTSVVVPDRVCLAGTVNGKAGLADIRGREFSGVDISREIRPPAGRAPRVNLDADFKLGVLEVIDATDWEKFGFHDAEGRADRIGDVRSDTDQARNRADSACLAGNGPRRAKG